MNCASRTEIGRYKKLIRRELPSRFSVISCAESMNPAPQTAGKRIASGFAGEGWEKKDEGAILRVV
jgi:hypothetical protein